MRYLDSLTETPVVRLTALTSAAVLPAPYNRFVSSTRGRYLIFSSDRTGAMAPFRVDLRSAAVQQLAETRKLDPRSVTLDAAERHLYFVDGGQLKFTAVGGRDERTLSEDVTAFALPRSGDPVFIAKGKLQTAGGGVRAEEAAGPCILSPNGALCLFTRGQAAETEFWSVSVANGSPNLLARGRISFPFWSPDSSSVIFLRESPDTGAAEIHEASSGGGNERLVCRTSRFAAFAPNQDGTVYVGASGSKAQPLIILLLRSTQRELPLCEHQVNDAASTVPVFSPDNRRVYFQSMREGKAALYSVNTELLVESAW